MTPGQRTAMAITSHLLWLSFNMRGLMDHESVIIWYSSFYIHTIRLLLYRLRIIASYMFVNGGSMVQQQWWCFCTDIYRDGEYIIDVGFAVPVYGFWMMYARVPHALMMKSHIPVSLLICCWYMQRDHISTSSCLVNIYNWVCIHKLSLATRTYKRLIRIIVCGSDF